jgi:hypothetical protein
MTEPMANHENPEGVDGRRVFSRLRVGIAARLETLAGSQKVRLIDLSQGGAQVILSKPEDAGAGVLSWLNFETFGDPAWTEEANMGLKFDQLLPLGCLVETRKRAPSVVRDEEMGTSMAQAWVSGEISDH